MRIAAVDDDPAQLDLLKAVVVSMGHDCHLFENANALMRVLPRETFDLFIVDWELPDIPGPDVIRAIRGMALAPVPILMMTNRSDERDIIEGLSSGADDYMVKSARVGELCARIMALLRRGGHTPPPSEIAWGPYRFQLQDRRVWLEEEEIVSLTTKEYDLALTMFRNLGRLLSRAHLIEGVWGMGADISSRSLDVYMSHVRSKLRLRADTGYKLVSVYNHGYRLEDLAQEASPTERRSP
ncbi:response regulator transcription factor [Hydrogenophaga sp. BPS33]|uniref:response regulator transcription factor n=1 Tax=Hydrogenophaga sp. BPS33 TaxID=2651974 RepID=UPI00132033C5|nr:response regulator transcription factor [Hydrogenophaga sp. BPS33]QHE87104.1 response regulator transcription factor [Hydrogenophaga sp. BPS33]